MWHRLARERGWSVKEAQAKVDHAEFIEWVAFNNLEPGPPVREDLRCAWISFQIVSALADKKKRPKFNKFIPEFDRHKQLGVTNEKERMKKAKQIKNQLLQWAKLRNKAQKKKRRGEM